jgi:hypothetical protein
MKIVNAENDFAGNKNRQFINYQNGKKNCFYVVIEMLKTNQ